MSQEDNGPKVNVTKVNVTAPFVWKPTVSSSHNTAPMATVKPPLVPVNDFPSIIKAIEEMNGYPMSQEQLRICEFVHFKEGNAIINAVAGSGKTTTLLYLLWVLPPMSRILMLSFNKSVQSHLQIRVHETKSNVLARLQRSMPPCEVKTAHAHGLTALRKRYSLQMENENFAKDNKSQVVAEAMNADEDPNIHTLLKPWKFHMIAMLKMLFNLALDCSDTTRWSKEFIMECGEKYGIPLPQFSSRAMSKKARQENEAYVAYFRVLRRAYEACLVRHERFDFSDMEYLPVRLGLDLTRYDVILVDEAQDLSAIQIEMISRSLHCTNQSVNQGSGRVIFVGDANQSIYGFRGSLPQSISHISERFRCVSLPLTISWRCSQRVVEVAADIVPEIRSRPNAPLGNAVMPNQDKVLDYIRERDPNEEHMILARTNAPLIDLAIQLQKEGIPAVMTAPTFCENLKFLLNQVESAHWINGHSLLDRAYKYASWLRESMKEKGEEAVNKTDRLDSLLSIIKATQRADMDKVLVKIDSIFSCREQEHDLDTCKLLTVHQAKGMESDVVYVIATHLFPHPKCKDNDWQLEQERNAQYIAITRAKQDLYYFV